MTSYKMSVVKIRQTLSLINGPYKELSTVNKISDPLRDKIQLSIWQIEQLQNELDELFRLESGFSTALSTKQSKNTLHSDYDLDKQTERLCDSQENDIQQSNQFLEKVFSVIRTHYTDPEFNVDTLSKHMGMSRSSFYTKLKTISGEAPADFIRQFRLEKASELLKSRQHSITEIAFKTGFSDVKYFREVFRKKFQMSPSQYAKNSWQAT